MPSQWQHKIRMLVQGTLTRYSKKYPSAQVLKLLSLLQLQPCNHGKNIRLEVAVIETIKHPNLQATTNNLGGLIKDIQSKCKKHFAEDPPEEFFTENIVFDNGNNVVFPGISTGGTEIVQGLVNCLSQTHLFSAHFIKEVKDGILLILHLHAEIARQLGYTHRMFEEIVGDDLFIPNEKSAGEMMNLFSFSRQTIDALSEKLGIASNTFDQFVFDWKNKGLNFTDQNANPLFQQPFITIGEEIILVMPSAELVCLNDFILHLAKKYQCQGLLLTLFAQQGTDELYPYFGRMYWKFEKHPFSENNKPELFLLTESFWRVDTDKLVYVTFMTEHPDYSLNYSNRDAISAQNTIRVEHESALIKQAYPGHQLLLLGVIQKSRVLGIFGLALALLKNSEYHLFFSLLELQVLTRVWKFDRLTLWKYVKYLHLAEDKIRFAPLNTHYSKYNWYIRNEESFFDPDQEPFSSALFGFEIEGDIRRK